MLPLRVWVDLEAIVMKGYSAFPKALGQSLGESYPSVEIQSEYSVAPAY